MLTTFFATIDPMLTLALCIGVGFLLKKLHLLSDEAGNVMAKLELYVFCPALNFLTMARFFTPQTLRAHTVNLVLSVCCVSLAILLGTLLAKLFVPKPSYDRNIYSYALSFSNTGYMGDPIVEALFGTEMLSYYKLYCLPISLMIYTWGITILNPAISGQKKGNLLRKCINSSTVSCLLGIAAGLIGLYDLLPSFALNSLSILKGCMGPVAMLLAGFTVASYPLGNMLKEKKVYLATLLRLFALPAVLVSFVFLLRWLGNVVFGLEIGNTVLFLCFFATATPLGLNTVVFPKAYGGNSEIGASMALISHTACVVTIPLLFALMIALFGLPTI